MKTAFYSALLILLSFTPTLAESCKDKFIRVLTDQSDKGPTKIHVTQEIKGGAKTTNYHYSLNEGHWMSEMITPANMAWTLVHNNTMYMSTDKGKSWKKVRDMNSNQNKKAAVANLKANAKTAKNAKCGKEELNGVMHETVEADYETLQNFKSENHNKYWINPKTGYISKAFYKMKAKNFESATTQLIEPAPKLTLPKP